MFGRYRIEGLLGRGGMGEVHRAHDTEQDRVVALKRLSVSLADEESKARFRRESRIAADLRAPHITTIYDYGEVDGQLYLAMLLVEGTDLRRVLDDGPLPAARAMKVLSQAAAALDAAHAAGVVHRDVKPANILLAEDDTAYLADFGIAKSLSPDATSVTRSGEIGTLDYMAPERLMHRGADHRADVYSLACVLFECLTGRKPFPADDSAGKLAAQLNDPPPAPSMFDWRIPRAVDIVIATGMDKDPDRRYPTAGELMVAATKAYQQQATTAPVTAPALAGSPEQGHIMDAILAVATRAPARTDQCPYPGLRSFSPAESELFHGREHAITDVLVRLSRQTAESGPLLVVGASGTGKSSLLRAGVLPALAGAERPWPQLVTTPGPYPVRTLAARLAPVADADADGLARWLYARPEEFGKLCAQVTKDRGGRLVLVVDQFEELFTLAAPREREAFATLLAHAWPALVVLAVRADFVDQCLRVPALRAAMARPYPLGPLAPTDLERVITAPARAAGLSVEDGLVDRLITDIGASEGGTGYDPGALPRLAHALRETWQHRTGPVLTLKGYQDTGGVDRAVALTADGVYNRLSEQDRAVLRTALLRMVTVLGDVAGGGVARRKADLAEIPDAVLAKLVEARLVTAEADGVQLSHDALLTAWPRLREWVEQDRQGLVLRQHLGQAASAWQAAGRDDGELYRGARLAATLEWAESRPDLTATEQGFLRESRRVQQRVTRRLRGLVTGLAVFLVVALAAGVLAAVKWGDATSSAEAAAREARTAQSRQLAAESLADAATDPVGAMHKALQAWHTSQTTQARGALLSSSTYSYPVTFKTGLPQATSVDVSPDGRYLAVGGPDGKLVVLETATGEPIDADFSGPTEVIHDVEFSPDGRMLASASGDATEGLRIWEMPSGRQLRALPAVGFAAWRADGKAIAGVGTPDDVHVAVGAWDPRTGAGLGWLTQPYPDMDVVSRDGAYSPDGTRFAVGRSDGAVELWDTRTTALVHADTAHLDAANDRGLGGAPMVFPQVAFSAESLVSASDLDRRIRFADPATGVPTGKSIDARYVGGDLEFTPDGGQLLTIAETAVAVARWSTGPRQGTLGDGAFVQGPTNGGIGAFSLDALAASAAGDVVGGQIDGDVVLWPHNPGWQYAPRNIAVRVAFSADGEQLSAFAADDRVYSWNPRTGEALPGPRAPAAAPFGIAYLPDGTRIVGTKDGLVTLDQPKGTDRAVRVGDGVSQGDIAVSPDGSMFAVQMSETAPGRAGMQVAVVVLDTKTLARRAVLNLGAATVSAPAFSPDGDTLIMATHDADDADPSKGNDEVRRWRTDDFTALPSVVVASNGNAILTPDGRSLVVATDNRVEIRDAETGEVRGQVGEHPSEVRAMAVSPDGRFLATGTVSDPVIRLWSLATKQHVASLTGHGDGVNHLAFSPDGGLLASASVDTDVGVWTVDPAAAERRVCGALARAGVENLTDLGCRE